MGLVEVKVGRCEGVNKNHAIYTVAAFILWRALAIAVAVGFRSINLLWPPQ